MALNYNSPIKNLQSTFGTRDKERIEMLHECVATKQLFCNLKYLKYSFTLSIYLYLTLTIYMYYSSLQMLDRTDFNLGFIQSRFQIKT